MAYANAAELRARYRVGIDRDEFAARDDADLTQALAAASAEVDSWRPPGTPGIAARAILAEKTLTLGRMLVYQDQALDESHPVVRDGLAVRAWLRALAAGAVQLPADAEEVSSTVVAPTRPLVFGAAFDTRYTL